MVNHVTEAQRSPAGWIRGQMGSKLREAVLRQVRDVAKRAVGGTSARPRGMVHGPWSQRKLAMPSCLPAGAGTG